MRPKLRRVLRARSVQGVGVRKDRRLCEGDTLVHEALGPGWKREFMAGHIAEGVDLDSLLQRKTK